MANVHIISIAYGLPDDLRAMWDAVDSDHDIHWHLFRHSNIPDVVAVCDELATRPGVTYYPYGKNRGLTVSTNEGLLNAFEAGADLVINIADDMLPQLDDVDKLVKWALHRSNEPVLPAGATHHNDYGGRYGMCALSFTAFNPCVLETVGMQDENLFPAYFEDNDYFYRLRLLGYEHPFCPYTKIVHAGSKNIRTHAALKEQNHQTFIANRAYYTAKWGGRVDAEKHRRPFGDRRFGAYIAPEDRHVPYPGYNRTDQHIVTI